MTAEPEFSRTMRIDMIAGQPRSLSIAANEKERAALAKRFGIAAIERLEAEAELKRRDEEITATGTLTAAVVQSCVATGADVPAAIEEPFTIAFRPHPQAIGAEEEIELREGELDVVFYEGSRIDLGEAVAETLALSLDPFPRSPEAEEALKEAGVVSEDEVEPAGPLAGLKDLLQGKK